MSYEPEFKLTEQHYRYLFDNANDAMWVHDMNGEILVANEACAKLTRYSQNELVGMNVGKFLAGEFLNEAREVKRKLVKGEALQQPYTQLLIRKNRTVGIVEMTTSLLIIGGEPTAFLNIARDVTEEKRMQENMRFYVQGITKAQEEERKRIARELHDDTSSHLLLLIQRLDLVTSQHPRFSTQLKSSLENLRGHALEALEGLQRCAQDLRPRILDDMGLIAALEWMADYFTSNLNIETRVEIPGDNRDLPSELQLLLFRIAQEALSNIRKHSEATKVLIKLELNDAGIRMTISDNGKGFEPPVQESEFTRSGKMGIAGMHERARVIGGRLEIHSAPGNGAEVVAEVPLNS